MKVQDSLGNQPGTGPLPVRGETNFSPVSVADFGSHLQKAEESSYEQQLEQLAREITCQGEILGKRVDVRELRVYKKLISGFLELALGHSKKFTKQSLLDRRGRHKVFAVIKSIDQELELLTQDVMSGEKDHISLLRRLGDIRGLILDMLL